MGLLTPLAVRLGSTSWLPRYLPQITAIDKTLQRTSGGRLTLLDIAGLPNLMLTVPGRRSGLPRSTPLLCVPREGSYLVAGSYFGGPVEPAWVGNLEAAGAGRLRFQRRTTPFTSRPLTGAERSAAWAELSLVWPNFALYARRTQREIKVFELTPVSGAA
ncbi:nitroreductase family deazaflavin-dependent oxidoreductase [Jatrophihabitans sp.]|uniref:nitroreductase family deazaflavin-dependent oxidoreductase n=1 Tax=Jatrophihabitans sp. TaxID=1932789 RepID=UPI0030C6E953|nr:putative nitroreductase [Jatrophihabitans sp.]